jgi:hypothetical protein
MADSNFRASRGRDARTRDDANPMENDLNRDPLAELARIIGQGEQGGDVDRGARRPAMETAQQPAPGQEWADDDRYAEPQAPQHYAPETYPQETYAEDTYAEET